MPPPVAPTVPRPEIAIHLFAVDDAVEYESTVDQNRRRSPDANLFVITLYNGTKIRQFGPQLSEQDKGHLAQILFSKKHVRRTFVGRTILWNILDIMRILQPRVTHEDFMRRNVMTLLTEKKRPKFEVTQLYKDTKANRDRAFACVKCYHQHKSAWAPHSNIELKKTHRLEVTASRQLIERYWQALPLFRLKWLELQRKTHVLDEEGYTIELKKSTPDDKKKFTGKCARYRVRQSDWSTHIVTGTSVWITDVRGDDHDAHVVAVDGRVCTLVLDRYLPLKDVKLIHIARGTERQDQIIEHLSIGKRLLCESAIKCGGMQFCAAAFGFPSNPDRIGHQKLRASRSSLASKYGPEMILRGHNHENKKAAEKALGRYEKHRRLIKPLLLSELTSPRCAELNDKQRRSALSAESIVQCIGYPGTGKTQTMAGAMLYKLNRLLKLRGGWILCLTNSNTAALSVLHQAIKYEELSKWIKYAYSPIYEAYHSEEFTQAFEYRTTPNMQLAPHGIMICTIGSLKRICAKHPIFPKLVFELMTDESGIHICIYTYIHIYMYTYIYIYVYTYIHIYIYGYIHIYVYTYIHTWVYTYIHIYIPKYIHIYIYTYRHIYIYIYTYIHIYIYTYRYTYIRIHIHTYIHIYIYTSIHIYYIHIYVYTYIYIYIHIYI